MKNILKWAEDYKARVEGTTSAEWILGGTELALYELAKAIIEDCRPTPNK